MPQPRHVPTHLVTLLMVAALMTVGCGPGGLPTPSPRGSSPPASPGEPPATTAPAATSTDAPAGTPAPTPQGGPPDAALAGVKHAAEGPLPGSLGTFTWGGLVSDSGWIVPAQGGATGPGAPLEIVLGPEPGPLTWRARWAPVTDAGAGDPVAGVDGGMEPIRIAAPVAPGTWSLVLEASYPRGDKASWFWRVEVVP